MRPQFPHTALSEFESLLQYRPKSPTAHIGRAKALDRLAEQTKSNDYLRKAIDGYVEVLNQFGAILTDEHFREIGERCVDRQRFSGERTNIIYVSFKLKCIHSFSKVVTKNRYTCMSN